MMLKRTMTTIEGTHMAIWKKNILVTDGGASEPRQVAVGKSTMERDTSHKQQDKSRDRSWLDPVR